MYIYTYTVDIYIYIYVYIYIYICITPIQHYIIHRLPQLIFKCSGIGSCTLHIVAVQDSYFDSCEKFCDNDRDR